MMRHIKNISPHRIKLNISVVQPDGNFMNLELNHGESILVSDTGCATKSVIIQLKKGNISVSEDFPEGMIPYTKCILEDKQEESTESYTSFETETNEPVLIDNSTIDDDSTSVEINMDDEPVTEVLTEEDEKIVEFDQKALEETVVEENKVFDESVLTNEEVVLENASIEMEPEETNHEKDEMSSIEQKDDEEDFTGELELSPHETDPDDDKVDVEAISTNKEDGEVLSTKDEDDEKDFIEELELEIELENSIGELDVLIETPIVQEEVAQTESTAENPEVIVPAKNKGGRPKGSFKVKTGPPRVPKANGRPKGSFKKK